MRKSYNRHVALFWDTVAWKLHFFLSSVVTKYTNTSNAATFAPISPVQHASMLVLPTAEIISTDAERHLAFCIEFRGDLSIYLWLYSPFVGPLPLFQFLIIHTVGRTPWTGNQPVARPLPTHRTTQIQNKCTQISMLWVGLEATIPASERAKTAHAIDRAATVIGELSGNSNLLGIRDKQWTWYYTSVFPHKYESRLTTLNPYRNPVVLRTLSICGRMEHYVPNLV
jgi:hypothetical protein